MTAAIPGKGGAPARPDGGMALVACTVTVFLLLMAVSSATSMTMFRQAAARTALDVDLALLAAESGLDRAWYEVQLATDFGVDGVGNATGIIGGGSYTVAIAPAFAGPGEYVITAAGTVRGITRRLQAVIRPSPVKTGFVGLEGISMSGGYADSYDSSLGTYASQVSGSHAGQGARLASNGNIALSGSATIWGDATPGPTGTVTGDTSLVSGSIAPATEPIVAAAFVYAPPIAATGAFSGSQVFAAGVYRFTAFNVPGGETVTFHGDVELYVDGKFTISGSGMGVLAPGARVKIYHGGNDFTLSGNGVINQDRLPSNLQVFSASTTKATVSGSAAFYGSIYAPGAAGTLSGSAGAYGAFQARTLTISGGAGCHYDLALGGGDRFEIAMVRPLVY